jgi:hypothetical protein
VALISLSETWRVSSGSWSSLGCRSIAVLGAWSRLTVVRHLVRVRILLVVGLAGAQAVLDRNAVILDYGYFAPAGRLLLSSRALDAFTDPAVQTGPLEIGLFGAGDLISPGGDHLALAVVVEAGLALAFMLLLKWFAPGRAGLQLLGGLAVLALGLPSTALTDGHPAQLAVPMMWLGSGLLAARRRPVAAGLLLGGSAGWETWGLLGLPVLLLGDGWRAHLRAGAAAVLSAGALFGPFVLAGRFHSGDYTWAVSTGSLPSLVLAPGASFGWPLRLAQAAIAVGAGLLVLRRFRGEPAMATWVTPLAVVATRLMLDPIDTGYYWVAPQVLAVVGLVAVLVHRGGIRLSAVAYLPVLASLLPGPALAAGMMGLLNLGRRGAAINVPPAPPAVPAGKSQVQSP